MASISTGKALLIGAAVVGAAGIGYVMLSKPARRASYVRENPVHRLGPRGGRTQIVSVMFSRRAGWTPSKARAWLRSHGKRTNIEVGPSALHSRQREPSKTRFVRYRTSKLGRGISARFGVLR